MTMTVCIVCGEPSTGPRCPEHALRDLRGSARARGYDARWDRLSKRARKLQPWCTDCGATEALTTDHSPQAWQRAEAGLALRLEDVEVVCGPCNNRRGAARGPQTRGVEVPPGGFGPSSHPKFGSHSADHTPRPAA